MLTGQIKGKKDRRKQRIVYLVSNGEAEPWITRSYLLRAIKNSVLPTGQGVFLQLSSK